MIDFHLFKKLADEYRTARPSPMNTSGYVVIFCPYFSDVPVAEAWVSNLDRPQGFVLDRSFAVGLNGDFWLATGGDDYEGADSWEPISLPNLPQIG